MSSSLPECIDETARRVKKFIITNGLIDEGERDACQNSFPRPKDRPKPFADNAPTEARRATPDPGRGESRIGNRPVDDSGPNGRSPRTGAARAGRPGQSLWGACAPKAAPFRKIHLPRIPWARNPTARAPASGGRRWVGPHPMFGLSCATGPLGPRGPRAWPATPPEPRSGRFRGPTGPPPAVARGRSSRQWRAGTPVPWPGAGRRNRS